MDNTSTASLPQQSSTTRQYWLFQIAGWSTMTLLSYVSLTLWYNPGQWMHALHTVLQCVFGLFVSHPLRYLAQRAWNLPLKKRILTNGIGIIFASLLWTSLRLLSFEWLTGQKVPPADYGGWLFASVIVYGSWIFCYHALKYSRQLVIQRELATSAQNAVLEAKNRAQEESMKRLTAESLYREARLRMLKYQINPHFLFNALNSVSAMVRKGEGDSATTMLSRIAEFLRITLEHDDELEHVLDEEIEVLDLYLSIEKARFEDRLQTDFRLSDAARQCYVPSFLLQPLFENAMKYAVGRSLKPTLISLEAWVEDGQMEIRVADTGPDVNGAAGTVEHPSMGIGLRNVEQRLRSSYGDNYRFDLAPNTPQGLMVSISVAARSDGPGLGRATPVDELSLTADA
ncbi:sensor histidine kinase [Parvularcula sp. LCG005]|uniref:sensor histidine kinase n=1 Tax=Parvularcula sp. LCG005 TaxID=3078805 RepID=UPI002942E082|nr:histidine kinase [Parvularcula sp. LCG005]WOI52663.1 histidine kinase [Parvularcula sp. LCG005]